MTSKKIKEAKGEQKFAAASEAAVKEAEAGGKEWAKTFDAITDFVFIQDKDFKFVKVNKTFCDALKKKPEDLIGKKCYEILHKSDKPWPNCPLAKTLKDKRPHTEEVNDPNIGVPLLISTSPLFDKKGEVTGVVHIAKDITERKKAEEELRKSEERFRVVMKGSPIIVAITNRELRYVWIQNPYSDFDPEAVIGKRDDELADNEGTQQLMQLKQQVIEREVGTRTEITFLLLTGSLTYDVTAEPLRDTSGRVIGVTTVALNITERKKLEEALQKSEQWFSTTLKSIGDAVIATDTKGNVIFLNSIAEFLTGWKQEEAAGKPLNKILNIINEKTGKPAKNPIKRVLREGVIVGLANHTVLIAKDGKRYPIADSGAPIKDDKGKIIGAVMVFRDITEHKKAEEIIKRKLEFEKTISSISSRFIGIFDIDHVINASLRDMSILSGASRSYLFLFRNNKEVMDNTHEWCAKRVSPQINNLKNLPSAMVSWWMKKLYKGKIIHIKDVSKLPQEAKAEKGMLQKQNIKSLLVLPLYIGEELAGFIGFDNVVKTEEWSDDDLALLRISSGIIGNALERKKDDEGKSEFLSNVSHALRTPLTSIKSFTEILLKYKDVNSVEHRKFLATINNETDRLTHLINKLLDLDKIEHGESKWKSAPCNILNIIQNSINEVDPLIKEKNIVLKFNLSSQNLIANGNEDKLKEVLVNLIGNAIKFTPSKGEIRITVKKKKETIEVSIADTGIGIPRDELTNIFERFNRLDNSINRKVTGTGLGLYICKQIIEKHEGKIWAESQGGKGTKFVFVLPEA